MIDFDRRSMVLGAASLAAAAWLPASRVDITAKEPAGKRQPLIARERDNILAAMTRDDVPGVAVCLLHQGEAVWVAGFGFTDAQWRRGVGADTAFSIQST